MRYFTELFFCDGQSFIFSGFVVSSCSKLLIISPNFVNYTTGSAISSRLKLHCLYMLSLGQHHRYFKLEIPPQAIPISKPAKWA